MKNKKINKRQFTLIELIIVIVVIGILAGMALPKFIGVQRNAKVAAMETDLDVIEKAVMQYVTTTDDGSYPFIDINNDKVINEEDLYFKTGTIPQTLTDSLLKASGDDGSKIYKLDMDKLKPYISKIKYPDTEYLYSEKSDTAIDPIGKADGDNFIHHIIGSGNVVDNSSQKEVTFVSMTQGRFHTIAIGSDGNLYGWGDNSCGELGIGNEINQEIPILITLPNNAKPKEVSVGELHTLVIGSDDNLYGTGYNGSGQLGLGDGDNRKSFEKAIFPSGIIPVSIIQNEHYSAFVICNDGNLYAWGDSGYDELNAGNRYSVKTPKKVTFPNETKPISVKTSYNHVLALCEDGNLYSFGENALGQLGLGDKIDRQTPQKVTFPNGVKPKEIFIEWSMSGALCDDGNFYTWGKNMSGQLGLGDNISDKTTPQKVIFPNGVKPKSISFAEYSSIVIGSDDNLYVWGNNSSGELGLGHKNTQYSPTVLNLPGNIKPKSAFTSYSSTFAIGEDGNLYSWGDNYYGKLGLGNENTQMTPQLVTMPNNVKVKEIQHVSFYSKVIGEDGNIYSSGDNRNGALGIGNFENQTTFKKLESIKKD